MSMKLEWNDDQKVYPIATSLIELLERILQEAAQMEDVTEGEVALTFVDDEQIHELNREYRGIDRPTDVLSFALHESTDEELDILYEVEDEGELESMSDLLGDIIISTERARAQADDYGHSLEREIGFLFVHGFLHLLGYDHQDEASERVMMDKQEAVLARIGLSR
ncbi:rRNA maturation RNase YbeY [Paenibacillus apiarius]|uniref:Endoribonuclease YbeY n=1 Tax=Paenibacillus apiarius TaxID=46240 RepID=A0ABT4DLH4_9BACL|nr:rRNA maturation RNase YbeY [Paenibacillus apiarius]MCY9513539.1 rRNA maturation RNase YbeY [Paenibacillus apiarius]MCY9518090.1 rRNA maturation RNase YbeY [Paenibacillus apiarius]MCY9551509.1 rRNA maturation RNase YbeY [Paenibacillus apiarius]MCY9558663.1 rRNA maturation RNase YbeY [Paenibacillus apiarius]MCY9684023.1 rRNA maturation RNase YbeY [Paenibacillus apiarius]